MSVSNQFWEQQIRRRWLNFYQATSPRRIFDAVLSDIHRFPRLLNKNPRNPCWHWWEILQWKQFTLVTRYALKYPKKTPPKQGYCCYFSSFFLCTDFGASVSIFANKTNLKNLFARNPCRLCVGNHSVASIKMGSKLCKENDATPSDICEKEKRCTKKPIHQSCRSFLSINCLDSWSLVI